MIKNAIVIGSGIAGMASAIRLAHMGFAVRVFEANQYAGGKITEIRGGGYRFDAGPSLFTMPHLVDELFRLCGEDPRVHFNYRKTDVACRYFWEDGTEITAWAEVKRFAKEASVKTGISQNTILDYLKEAGERYEITAPVFLEKSLHKLKDQFTRNTFLALLKTHKLSINSTLHNLNKQKLQHPKMVQLFDRFATYNGSSPYLTPGVMSLISHLEHNRGSYYPLGGMHAITKSIYDLAKRQGVIFNFNERVKEINLAGNKAVVGVSTEKDTYKAPVVFSNMDVVPTYRQLLKTVKAPERTLSQARSSSAVVFYWGMSKQFPQLDLHNIFFSDNYREEFKMIFEKGAISADPTVYINVTSKEDPEDAPPGCENWFVMINVPPNTGQDWSRLIATCREQVISKLNRLLRADIESLIEFEDVLDPIRLESRTSSYQGALYGASSNSILAAFLRHPNFSRKIEGLYFCGGSVHPGGGIPLCLLSAKIATSLVPDKI